MGVSMLARLPTWLWHSWSTSAKNARATCAPDTALALRVQWGSVCKPPAAARHMTHNFYIECGTCVLCVVSGGMPMHTNISVDHAVAQMAPW